MHLADIGRKAEVFGNISMILWRMIPVRHQADSQVLLRLKFPRFEDMCTYGFDILRSRLYVAALTSGAVLYEDKIPDLRI